MIRKISVGLAVLLSGLTANTNAFAKSPVDVSVPCYNGGFTFGLAGLYLRPSSTALDYASSFKENISSSEHDSLITINAVNPKYDWGYSVNLGMNIPGTGNDVALTYTEFNHTTTDTTVTHHEDKAFSEVEGKAKFNYQTADLDIGQRVNLGCRSHLRFIGGLRFADLDTNFRTSSKESNGNVVLNQFDSNERSQFHGVGPRAGTEFEYSLGSGFGIVGRATGALIVGQFKDRANVVDVDFDNDGHRISQATAQLSRPKTTQVVPNLNAKLALDYHYQFCSTSPTKLTVEAGYQVDHFFNASDRLDPANKQSIDTSLSGPYVGVQVHL